MDLEKLQRGYSLNCIAATSATSVERSYRTQLVPFCKVQWNFSMLAGDACEYCSYNRIISALKIELFGIARFSSKKNFYYVSCSSHV